MIGWSDEDVAKIGTSIEFGIASRRPDGSLRPYVTIWGVRVGDDLYVRSAHGYDNPWFQRALKSGDGRIRVGGFERDVAFEAPEPNVAGSITAAYHAKYDRYGPSIVGTVVSAEAQRSTLRLVPR
jgi:hypothetical protein